MVRELGCGWPGWSPTWDRVLPHGTGCIRIASGPPNPPATGGTSHRSGSVDSAQCPTPLSLTRRWVRSSRPRDEGNASEGQLSPSLSLLPWSGLRWCGITPPLEEAAGRRIPHQSPRYLCAGQVVWACAASRTGCSAFRCLTAEPGRSTQVSNGAVPSHGSSSATSASQRTGAQSTERVRRLSPATASSSRLATSYPTRTRPAGRQFERSICPRSLRQVASSRGTSGSQVERFASPCNSVRCPTREVARLQTPSSLASAARRATDSRSARMISAIRVEVPCRGFRARGRVSSTQAQIPCRASRSRRRGSGPTLRLG
jgi:hypothetical protein